MAEVAGESSHGPHASRKTQVISTVVTLVTLAIVFFYLFPKFGSYEQAIAYMQSMDTPAIVLFFFAIILNVLVYVWPFLVALPGLHFRPGFIVRQTSFLISNTIPAGGAFGLALQYAMLGSYGFGAGPTTSAIAVNSLWNILVTMGMPAVGALALVVSGELTTQGMVLGLISLAVIAVAAVLLHFIMGSVAGARRIGAAADAWAARLLRLVRHPRELNLTQGALDLRTNMADTVNDHWARLSVSNLAMQLTAWFVLFVALRGIQTEAVPPYVTWSQCLAAFALSRLATFIPITPGGLGTTDAAMTALLTSFGATSNQALAATLLWRAGTFVPQAILGVISFLIWRFRERRRRLPVTEVAHPTGPASGVGD